MDRVVKSKGRPRTRDNAATRTGSGSPLAIGRIIAHLCSAKKNRAGEDVKALTYEKARAVFTETDFAGRRYSKNTIDKYWKIYKENIRKPAKVAVVPENKFVAEHFDRVTRMENGRRQAARSDAITLECLPSSPVRSPDDLAVIVEDFLKNVGANEAVRIRNNSMTADCLIVTIRYKRLPPKKSRPK